ncbi:MAG: hypothetical protein HC845_15550 [Akkermansiaceae bacterium]|nr:hypothetical protein [Akkermansiaceae bacterium]
MKILSHRGYWKSPEEKNLNSAFERSFALGFGTETDIRDLKRSLVISHDMPEEGCLTARELFEIHQRINPSVLLALNIKADGLQAPLSALIEEYAIKDYFLFDMSVPDALVCLRHGLKCFTRQSEYEPDPAFYSQAEGVWIDGFHGEWWEKELIQRHLDSGKRVCIVSPELHKRPHLPLWEKLSGWDCAFSTSVMLCTDFPEAAKEMFGDLAL